MQKKFRPYDPGDGTTAAISALARDEYDCLQRVSRQMGGRGKDDEMKHRKTNLDPVEPAEKPEMDDPMARVATHAKPEARLGREVQARIGQQLRAIYNDVINQGVPQHITDLVRRLSDQEQE